MTFKTTVGSYLSWYFIDKVLVGIQGAEMSQKADARGKMLQIVSSDVQLRQRHQTEKRSSRSGRGKGHSQDTSLCMTPRGSEESCSEVSWPGKSSAPGPCYHDHITGRRGGDTTYPPIENGRSVNLLSSTFKAVRLLKRPVIKHTTFSRKVHKTCDFYCYQYIYIYLFCLTN